MAKGTDSGAGKAKFSYVRMTPRKIEGIADLVRGKSVEEALALLTFTARRGAGELTKIIRSAVANADQRGGIDVDRLYVRTILVNSGPHLKRWRARSRGMAHPILKRTSHIEVILGEK
ncbi:MAG: 50S ribosomal protein L22 [Deltaproteobacteria bacterium]|nr:50S ribosomal protein L22 [Deltaproteobacteria bacterium]